MTEQEKPKWMSDELVKDISPKKLDFLAQMFTQGQGKSQKEMMIDRKSTRLNSSHMA